MAPVAPKAEPIPAPKGGEPGKKMPEGKSVQLVPESGPPALEVTPASTPRTVETPF